MFETDSILFNRSSVLTTVWAKVVEDLVLAIRSLDDLFGLAAADL